MGGYRLEESEQRVETFELFNPDMEPVVAALKTADWLPAATGTLGLGCAAQEEELLLRFAYGKTLSRPDFRELSPVTFNDVTGGRQVFGNPDLQRTLIDNYDPAEWYPAPVRASAWAASSRPSRTPSRRLWWSVLSTP